MMITAVIDRIENGNAILLSEETGIEVSIPVEVIKGTYKKGEKLFLTIEESFSFV